MRNDMTLRQDMRKNDKVIRGQGQGHGPVKYAKMADFEVYLLRYLLKYPEFR